MRQLWYRSRPLAASVRCLRRVRPSTSQPSPPTPFPSLPPSRRIRSDRPRTDALAYHREGLSTPFHTDGRVYFRPTDEREPTRHRIPFWAYGDSSCVMGSASSAETCFNAPQARSLGYAKPVADVNVSDIVPVGAWRSYSLPVFTSSVKNHITLTSDDLFPVTIVLSLRSKISSADGKLNQDYSDVLSVHAQNKDPSVKPMIIALVREGSTFSINASTSLDDDYGGYGKTPAERQGAEMLFRNLKYGLNIRLVSLNENKTAIVSISRS